MQRRISARAGVLPLSRPGVYIIIGARTVIDALIEKAG
ncbi:hypothetical protein SALB1_0052 [Salinisphaera sp. LB1]|nr:hypothetical protein SALB1_0052 [Salinisphaera sp. LB1]